jgi:hypothetical protein
MGPFSGPCQLSLRAADALVLHGTNSRFGRLCFTGKTLACTQRTHLRREPRPRHGCANSALSRHLGRCGAGPGKSRIDPCSATCVAPTPRQSGPLTALSLLSRPRFARRPLLFALRALLLSFLDRANPAHTCLTNSAAIIWPPLRCRCRACGICARLGIGCRSCATEEESSNCSSTASPSPSAAARSATPRRARLRGPMPSCRARRQRFSTRCWFRGVACHRARGEQASSQQQRGQRLGSWENPVSSQVPQRMCWSAPCVSHIQARQRGDIRALVLHLGSPRSCQTVAVGGYLFLERGPPDRRADERRSGRSATGAVDQPACATALPVKLYRHPRH